MTIDNDDYVKSLIGLGQYFEAVEVIHQIIDEVKDHKTRMALHPLKEFAKSKLIEDEKRLTQSLADFDTLSLGTDALDFEVNRQWSFSISRNGIIYIKI